MQVNTVARPPLKNESAISNSATTSNFVTTAAPDIKYKNNVLHTAIKVVNGLNYLSTGVAVLNLSSSPNEIILSYIVLGFH